MRKATQYLLMVITIVLALCSVFTVGAMVLSFWEYKDLRILQLLNSLWTTVFMIGFPGAVCTIIAAGAAFLWLAHEFIRKIRPPGGSEGFVGLLLVLCVLLGSCATQRYHPFKGPYLVRNTKDLRP